MVRHRRTPGVQHQRDADLCAEVLGVGGDGRQRFRRHLEQQPVDHRLVGIGDGADRCRQREDHVVILDRQQVGLPGFEPALRGPRLALRAMPVAAGVVADFQVAAGITAQHVSSQRRGAALFDGRHDLELGKTQVARLRFAPRRTKGAEDVGDFQGGTPHGRPTASSRFSNGLITSRRMSVATWV